MDCYKLVKLLMQRNYDPLIVFRWVGGVSWVFVRCQGSWLFDGCNHTAFVMCTSTRHLSLGSTRICYPPHAFALSRIYCLHLSGSKGSMHMVLRLLTPCVNSQPPLQFLQA